jgi:sporulation protein YlmC with PRC-barrel domain
VLGIECPVTRCFLKLRCVGASGVRALVFAFTGLNNGLSMNSAKLLLSAILFAAIGTSAIATASAECQIADAKLEEAVLQKPALRGVANRQYVRDLRSLRDAAFTLRSYGRHEDCERLLGSIRELVSAPSMGTLGDNDEEEAEKQMAARQPKVQRGTLVGRREDKDAKPLINIDTLATGLRAAEIIGAEVRSSDDKIVGEVRDIVFATKDRRDYAIVASGGFFTPGDASIVVPIRTLKVSREGDSFFLPIADVEVKAVLPMPDQHFRWLSDEAWRNRNDALFARP